MCQSEVVASKWFCGAVWGNSGAECENCSTWLVSCDIFSIHLNRFDPFWVGRFVGNTKPFGLSDLGFLTAACLSAVSVF